MQIIEAIHDAGQEMNYSNYHNGLFDKAKQIIREWAADRGIPLGQTQKEREEAYAVAQQAEFERIMSKLGVAPEDLDAFLEGAAKLKDPE